jgi:hypothetical protein
LEEDFAKTPPGNMLITMQRATKILLTTWTWVGDITVAQDNKVQESRKEQRQLEANEEKLLRASCMQESVLLEVDIWKSAHAEVVALIKEHLHIEKIRVRKNALQESVDKAVGIMSSSIVHVPLIAPAASNNSPMERGTRWCSQFKTAVDQEIRSRSIGVLEDLEESPTGVGCLWLLDLSNVRRANVTEPLAEMLSNLTPSCLVVVLLPELGSARKSPFMLQQEVLATLFGGPDGRWFVKNFPVLWTRTELEPKCLVCYLARRSRDPGTAPTLKKQRISVYTPEDSPWGVSHLWNAAGIWNLVQPTMGYRPRASEPGGEADGSASDGDEGNPTEGEPDNELPDLLRNLGQSARIGQHGTEFWNRVIQMGCTNKAGVRIWSHMVVAAPRVFVGDIPAAMLPLMIVRGIAGAQFSPRKMGLSGIFADYVSAHISSSTRRFQRDARTQILQGLLVEGCDEKLTESSFDGHETMVKNQIQEIWEHVALKLRFFKLRGDAVRYIRHLVKPTSWQSFCHGHSMPEAYIDAMMMISPQVFQEGDRRCTTHHPVTGTLMCRTCYSFM